MITSQIDTAPKPMVGDERQRPTSAQVLVIDGAVRLPHLDEDVTDEVKVAPHD